ncbi:unnamed protein product [Penicillium salamii]|nr:unnamed protein product [Penicillium salamii]
MEHRRMEKCLYKHRKDWEGSGQTDWIMMRDYTLDNGPRENKYLPFYGDYYLEHQKPYKRPDPFDAAHQCGDDKSEPTGPDEYDQTIDWDSRRQRLRKGFEWEMDRLYLIEEIGIRQRDEKERQKNQEKADAEAARRSKEAENPTVFEPQIKRMDWYGFRRIPSLKVKPSTIDILMGEPLVDTMLSYGSWFGYSSVTSRKPKRAQTNVPTTARNPEESALPERIRVHSGTLLKIMAKILGSDGSSLEGLNETPVVFLRPFKALVYCEEQLRRGCTELEKKFTVSSDALVADSTVTEVLNEQNSTVTEPEQKNKPSLPPKTAVEETEEDDDEDYEDENEKDQKVDEDTGSLTALKHLRCLLQFLDEDIKPKRDYLLRSEGRKVFFSDLWYVFRPGMEVISSDGKQAYRIIQVKSARHRVIPQWKRFHQSSSDDKEGKKPEAPFSLHCVYIDFDGKNLGPVSKVFEFKRFEGQQDITSLEVYPLKLYQATQAHFSDEEWKNVDTLPPSARSESYRQKLIERGRKFLDVVGVKHMYYAGPTLGVRDEVESQVVIDFETAFTVEDEEQVKWKPTLELLVGRAAEEPDEEDRNCSANCCRADQVHDDSYVDMKQRTDYIDSLLPKENEAEKPLLSIIPRPLKELRGGASKSFIISDDEMAIMSYRVFGFVLRTRKWAKLDLSYLSNVQQSEARVSGEKESKSNGNDHDSKTAFERLVLEPKHKDMIVSLVSQHFRDKDSTTNQREQFDIVRGKGKGLIILLHGEPGVGKTSTAEGVAEQFRKPLFQITCGDLGTTSKEVEKALETTFALANRWDCILLLDEADVFLSRRTKEDFQRNGLVAVFLRVMEYYAGILFLTTNRVGDFDEAFTSRIHVSLWYKPLDDVKTANIFKLNLELIKERFIRKGRKIAIEEVEIAVFALKHFNEHKSARWNGRQIRNACQTALALAEYDSQELSQTSTDNPDVTVKLSVSHFEVVRDAYVEFTSYIDELYGTDASKRAHEERLRTARSGDPSHHFSSHSGSDFAQMSRGQMPGHAHQPSQFSNPDFQTMSRPGMMSQPQNYQYSGYSNPGPSMYSGYAQPPTQERPNLTDDWSSRGPNIPVAAAEPLDAARYQSSPRAQAQTQRPLTPDSRSRVAHGVEAMYEGAISQGHAHESPRAFAPYSRGYGP